MTFKIIDVNSEFIEEMDKLRQPDKSLGLIGASQKNAVVFAERMLGMRPDGMVVPAFKNEGDVKLGHIYSWQVFALTAIQEAIKNRRERQVQIDVSEEDKIKVIVDSREYVIITSRQVGKSVLLAILGAWACVFNSLPCGASDSTAVIIISASDVQAKKLLYEIKKFLRIGDRFLRDAYKNGDGKSLFGEDFFTELLDENEANNTTTITFKPHDPAKHGKILLAGSRAGSTIKSYAPTAVVLGETGSLLIEDEAGMTDRITDTFHYDYLYPTGNSTDAVRVYTSTPWKSSGFFYRMVDPDGLYPDNDAVVVAFTIDAIALENPNYHETVMKTVKQLQGDGKNNEVQRAYYCRFVKGESSYFNPDDVIAGFADEANVPFDKLARPCDMGVDFGGQVKSQTVITISELADDGHVYRRYCKTYEVGKDTELVTDMEEIMQWFNVQRVIVDDCAAGVHFIRQMEEKGWDIHPMSFRADKVKKYGAFRVWLKRGKIHSYFDEDLKIEMLALEFTPGARQSNIQHSPGGSDDLIDSFIMSTYFFVDDETGVKFYQW